MAAPLVQLDVLHSVPVVAAPKLLLAELENEQLLDRVRLPGVRLLGQRLPEALHILAFATGVEIGM